MIALERSSLKMGCAPPATSMMLSLRWPNPTGPSRYTVPSSGPRWASTAAIPSTQEREAGLTGATWYRPAMPHMVRVRSADVGTACRKGVTSEVWMATPVSGARRLSNATQGSSGCQGGPRGARQATRSRASPDAHRLARITKMCENPRMLGEHGYEDHRAVMRRLGAKQFLARQVTRLTTVSSHLERLLIERWNVPPERVTFIPNGIDLDRFPLNGDSQSPRREFGQAPEHRV